MLQSEVKRGLRTFKMMHSGALYSQFKEVIAYVMKRPHTLGADEILGISMDLKSLNEKVLDGLT